MNKKQKEISEYFRNESFYMIEGGYDRYYVLSDYPLDWQSQQFIDKVFPNNSIRAMKGKDKWLIKITIFRVE